MCGQRGVAGESISMFSNRLKLDFIGDRKSYSGTAAERCRGEQAFGGETGSGADGFPTSCCHRPGEGRGAAGSCSRGRRPDGGRLRALAGQRQRQRGGDPAHYAQGGLQRGSRGRHQSGTALLALYEGASSMQLQNYHLTASLPLLHFRPLWKELQRISCPSSRAPSSLPHNCSPWQREPFIGLDPQQASPSLPIFVLRFVLQGSLVRPLGSGGAMRLASDCAQLEFGLSRYLSIHT